MKTFLSILCFSVAVSTSAAVVTKWTAHIDRSAFDQAVKIGMDATGNLYLAANTAAQNAHGSPDKPLGWFVAKYSAAGVNAWVTSSSGNADVFLRDMVIEPSGQIVVVGSIYGESYEQMYAARLGSDGAVLWEHRDANASPLTPSSGNAVVSGPGGVTWIGGSIMTNDIGFPYPVAGLLVSLDGAGNETRRAVDSLPNLYQTAGYSSIALDRSSALVLRQPGYSTNEGWKAYVVKYSLAGERQWFQKTDIIDLSSLGKYPLAGPVPDANGNLFITGPVLESDFHVELLKLAPTGGLIWRARYSPRHGGGSDATDLAVDAAGNVVVTGNSDTAYIYDDFYVRDIFTIKFDADGKFRWLSRGTAPATPIIGRHVAVDVLGNIYVAGEGAPEVTASFRQTLSQTMRFNRLGQREWLESQTPGPGPGIVAGILRTGRGDIVIGGSDQATFDRPVDAYLVDYREKLQPTSPHFLGPVKVRPQGADIVLSVNVSGRGPFRYEWFRDGVPVGSTPSTSSSPTGLSPVTGAAPVTGVAQIQVSTRSLRVPNDAEHAGEYYVQVSNSLGSVVSEVVRIGLPGLDAVVNGSSDLGTGVSVENTTSAPRLLD